MSRSVMWKSKLCGAVLAVSAAVACGPAPTEPPPVVGEGEGEGEPTPPVAEHETRAPLCDDRVGEGRERELFPFALVDPEEVEDAIPFGNMEPYSPQEVLNHEIGFYIPGVLVPLTSPTDLYVQSIERSVHDYDGVTDWSVAYHVCSFLDGDVRRPAVLGNFAHVTTLSEPLQAFFDQEMAKRAAGEPSAAQCNDDETECGVSMNAYRDLIDDHAWAFVLEGGEPLGTGGRSEPGVGPAGVDTNLQDRRINDFAGNYYINPDRLGAEAGPGFSWRYGTCFYDYFAEPYRTQYFERIRVFGETRESETEPCGSLEVDRGAEGTVRGVWASTELAAETMDPEYSAAEIDVYLERTLVLGDHFTRPDTHMMISTPLDVLSDWGGGNSPIVIEREPAGSDAWNNAVNVPFRDTEAGTVYCYAGERFGGFQEAYYLAEVSADGDVLTFERVDEDCSLVSPSDRAFHPASPTWFQMVR